MGLTQTRLRAVTERMASGENNAEVMYPSSLTSGDAPATVAAAAFAGVLITLVKSQPVRDLLMGIISSALGQ